MSSRAPSHSTYDEFDNGNNIDEVTNDVHDCGMFFDNQVYEDVDNYESLIVEPIVGVEDCDTFIDTGAIVDETTHDRIHAR
ncbi:hypothetical protein Tco_0719004 [Tanacetum coccineum]